MFQELKVIDLSTVLAGPSVATFFAELGASVIKVENPKNKDVTRTWKLPSEDTESESSAYFSSVNYKKKYIELDLSLPKDKEILLKMIADSDVLITNFKKGDADKFGLSDQQLFKINHRLIHAKISGFGTESDRLAYDIILQAETGFLSMNGSEDSGPIKLPVALIDVLAAHQLKEAILIALLNREKTQEGSVAHVSLYDAAVCSLANQASNYLMQNHIPQRIGMLHPNIAPYGELFLTKDKKEVVFAIGSNAHFQALCSFLNLNELALDHRFSTNPQRVIHRKELEKQLSKSISNFESADLATSMQQEQIPMGIIKNLEEVFQQPEAQRLVATSQTGNTTEKRVTQLAFQIKPYGN